MKSETYLPQDIAFKIISSLQVSDVCSLGSCSQFWRELCLSDSVWKALYRDRWPTLVLAKHDSSPNFMYWKEVYARKHAETSLKAAALIDFVEQRLSGDSIEVGNYLKAIEEMHSMMFGFHDVQMFFLKPKLNAVLNLIGLHYCIVFLNVPAKRITETLKNHSLLDKQVCVQWWKLGRWFYGYRLRDEMQSRDISLADLTTAKEREVLGVLQRGVVHEVLRVRITVSKPMCSPWPYQNMPQYE
ncbi:hypothetical protein Leryth_019116 [Lithospermum erythrorhizon]|nr:hypothetical protein Leryth_019116 [Lithospermum erythrorhizon]